MPGARFDRPRHQGRTTEPRDVSDRPPRRPLVTITAWTIVAVFVLAAVVPVLLLVFG